MSFTVDDPAVIPRLADVLAALGNAPPLADYKAGAAGLSAGAGATPRCEPRELASVKLDSVEPERVSWLWDGRIPFGKVTIVEGDPGAGKGHLVAAVTAAVTTGAALPGGEPHESANAVLVSLEDGTADVLRPRMEAAGADLARVRVVTELPSIPADVAPLAALVHQDDARLLVLDPITAYLGSDTDSYKDQDTRRALLPLAELAERAGCAVVLVRHLPKSRNRNAVLAGAGSIAFIGLARTALFVAPKPDDPERRILAVAKSNLAEIPESLEFRITAAAGASRLEWLGRSEFTAGALHAAHAEAAHEDASQTAEAAGWLRDVLTGREGMPRSEVLKAGRAEGFSDRTVHRAAKKAGVVMARRGFAGGSVWSLSTPSADSGRPFVPSTPHSCHQNNVARMGTNGTNGAAEPALGLPAATQTNGDSGSVRDVPELPCANVEVYPNGLEVEWLP